MEWRSKAYKRDNICSMFAEAQMQSHWETPNVMNKRHAHVHVQLAALLAARGSSLWRHHSRCA